MGDIQVEMSNKLLDIQIWNSGEKYGVEILRVLQ